jgi:hypothetical protein
MSRPIDIKEEYSAFGKAPDPVHSKMKFQAVLKAEVPFFLSGILLYTPSGQEGTCKKHIQLKTSRY